jgi:hypothetical protein
VVQEHLRGAGGQVDRGQGGCRRSKVGGSRGVEAEIDPSHDPSLLFARRSRPERGRGKGQIECREG